MDNDAIILKDVCKKFTINAQDMSIANKKKKIIKKENIVLDQISLNISKGEILGIIGKNGSGKSTLMSIISKIIFPDQGSVTVNGKVAAILELGMGFHYDLSGRENIYLKGELYGFSKKKMDEISEEIISYSGLQKYIDNPLRTYSSGMIARLAFSIMIHVNAEIIVVDEVLSVGDLSFAEKSKAHFKKLSKSNKTVIISSHDISFLEDNCTRVIWLNNGKIIKDGNPKIVCSEYKNVLSEDPQIIKELAESEIPEAQYKLALMFRDGINIEKNEKQYVEYLKKASDNGHILAKITYGDHLKQNNNLSLARHYYKDAAELGDPTAKLKLSATYSDKNKIYRLINSFSNTIAKNDGPGLFLLGDLLLKNASSFKQQQSAYDTFLKSAQCQYAPAYYQLANMARLGIGISRNTSLMCEYLTHGSNLGNMPCILALANYYKKGGELLIDEVKSFNYYKKAALMGNPEGMYNLAIAYYSGKGTKEDENLSEIWFKRYVDATLIQHQLKLAEKVKCTTNSDVTPAQLYFGPSEESNVFAISSLYNYNVLNNKPRDHLLKTLNFLAQCNNVDALRKLGDYYYTGCGVEINYSTAREYYIKATKLNDIWAHIKLSEIYRDGLGVPKDVVHAIELLIAAAQSGNVGVIILAADYYQNNKLDNSNLLNRIVNILNNFANMGSPEALRKLGQIYFEGKVLPQNLDVSKKYFESASRLGDKISLNYIKIIN